jgi:hypothetical protein
MPPPSIPPDAAQKFMEQRFPLFNVPSWVKQELEACGVGSLKGVTPAVVRELLKRQAANGQLSALHFTPEVSADLLAFCLSDVLVPEGASQADEAGRAAGSAIASPLPLPPPADGPAAGTPGALMAAEVNRVLSSWGGPQLGQIVNAALGNSSMQGVLDMLGGEMGLQQAQVAQASAPLPVNLDALRDCKGLPYVAANGRILNLGSQR